MRRRRSRTIPVAHLDRIMAEAEAIPRAIEAGARNAWARESDRRVGHSVVVWGFVLRVIPRRRRAAKASQAAT